MTGTRWIGVVAATALLVGALLGVTTLTGCETDAQTGAILGSAVGAAAGAGIDHNNRGRGALIGAAGGALGGYAIGNEVDKSKARQRDAY